MPPSTAHPPAVDPERRFDWPLCYEAEALAWDLINAFLEQNEFARTLARRMRDETGTLILDWVDHLVVDASKEEALRNAGYAEDTAAETCASRRAFSHPEAMLPEILLDITLPEASVAPVLALRVDSIEDFTRAHRLHGQPEGDPHSRYRRLVMRQENLTRLDIVERRGYRGYVPAPPDSVPLEPYLQARELWETRPRQFNDDAEGFAKSHDLLDRIIALTGNDLACHIVFKAERDYWQGRNGAARVQFERQNRLGLGWANHDHHTFRSSRRHFLDLMRVMEKLGFERRERYYAGQQAGWGAQIWEQPVEGIVTFCDVDLTPDETDIDFSREPLSDPRSLGTIGLWVGLHGESFLQAGMHHLECRFDYQLLRDQLLSEGINTMNPFSDFPFLKQAFTEGERWSVQPERVNRLLERRLITAAQARTFLKDGAIGSHLENLQRKGGFKGFNQHSVSVIIDATDPRKQGAAHH